MHQLHFYINQARLTIPLLRLSSVIAPNLVNIKRSAA